MKKANYNSSDIILCDVQHTVRHTNTDKFKIGEKVFLKSNPECPMSVSFIDEKEIIVQWFDKLGGKQTMSLPPECILQYRYAGLVTHCGFELSLN